MYFSDQKIENRMNLAEQCHKEGGQRICSVGMLVAPVAGRRFCLAVLAYLQRSSLERPD
jgi:hypothetical protein